MLKFISHCRHRLNSTRSRKLSPYSLVHSPRKRGFTLVETILYLGIASVFIAFMIGFYWQMRQGGVQASISTEVKENGSQAVELIKFTARNGEGLNQVGSAFDSHPGVLELDYSDGNRRFETYQKNVTVGGSSVTIRKLRFNHVGSSINDITSDHVDVVDFQVSDYTVGGEPESFQIDLTLNHVNPGSDPVYDESFSTRGTFNIRSED